MQKRPNIMVIMSDDHAQWASGCYGNRELHTPVMDHLAASGVRMDNAFTPTPVCSPARASFWTGLIASQHGIHDFIKTFGGHEAGTRNWLETEVTLANLLHDAGYQTSLTGKWHCGKVDGQHAGFDDWFTDTGDSLVPHMGKQAFEHNGQVVERSGYTTQIVTDHAISFIRERDPDKPFFQFIGYTATHSPWLNQPERLVRKYRHSSFDDIPSDAAFPFGRNAGESLSVNREDPKEALAQYYAAVTHIDEGIGRLLDELEAQQLRRDTLIVYTSDHGLNCGHHGIWGKGNGSRPLNMLEESIRVPLIFNQPGTLFAGQARIEFVDHTDLFSTLLAHAGVELPSSRRFPGCSFLSLLTSGLPIPNWKNTQLGEYGNLRMIRTLRHKLIRRFPDGPSELFDLQADPRETINLFDNPEQQRLIQDLTSKIETYFSQYEHPVKTGLRVKELPIQNPVEAWRD
jgi:arylsulfatase A-like enzyme